MRANPPHDRRPSHSRLLRCSATANLEGSLGVGGQNDVGWLLEGEGDERWDQLLAEFPQSGQAMYQSAVFFFGRADYIPGQAMPRDAAERFARGWELYKAALRAEPLNFHYHATLGREVGLLRPRAAAAGVALPADLPQAGAVLEAAAALQDSVLELKRQAIEETLGTAPSAERSPLDYRPEYSAALEAVRASCGAEDSLGASLALRNWHRLLHRELLQAERGEEATRALDELPDAHVADLEPRGALTDLCAEHGLPDPRGALECLAKGEYGGVLAAAEGLERKLREVCEAGGGGEPEQVVVESLDALPTVWG